VISKLINESCNNIRVAGKYHITIAGDMTLEVNADAERIDQVIINFVNNATKYAPNSTEIVLLIERLPMFVKVSVTDQGPGIAPDKQQHLFARYYRADNSGNQYSGLGLGLYISSEIIKKHNGEIGVISEPGKGSTFWFTLPLQ
jgi:signal transduction histidine kinase